MGRDLSEAVYEGADVMDTRDVVARLKELEAELDTEDPECDEDDAEELQRLKALVDELPNAAMDGEALINDSYFQEYAEQLADDIGAIDRHATWPLNCIDWERAADELKNDYTSVTYGETTYWVRYC